MRILIAISSREFSESTLRTGTILADRLGVDVTVCYVGPKRKERGSAGIKIIHDSMASWEIYHPGLEVLRWACKKISEWGFCDNSICDMDPSQTVLEAGRIRAVLPNPKNSKIELLLREGEPFAELHKETLSGRYFLTVVGGGVKRSVTNKLIQFVDTDLLFAKNFHSQKNDYRILIPVDDSASTRHAVMMGGLIARQFGLEIDALTVSKKDYFGPGYSGAAKKADKYFTQKKIAHKMLREVGDPVEKIIEIADDSHIVVMGTSRSTSEWKKFFRGTKPGDTVVKANCPVLLVR